MEDRNSTSKMTPEQLEKWLALRKKCHVHKSKKDYTRKEKHKKDYEQNWTCIDFYWSSDTVFGCACIDCNCVDTSL